MLRKPRGWLESRVAKVMAAQIARPPSAPCEMRSGMRRPKSFGPMNDQLPPGLVGVLGEIAREQLVDPADANVHDEREDESDHDGGDAPGGRNVLRALA